MGTVDASRPLLGGIKRFVRRSELSATSLIPSSMVRSPARRGTRWRDSGVRAKVDDLVTSLGKDDVGEAIGWK